MRIEPFQAVYPNFEYITSVDAFFDTVKEDYPEYRHTGFFKKVSEEAVYVYEIKRSGRSHTGLLCCTDIGEYDSDLIKKHENTLPAKEQQQMHLMISRNALVKPILVTHPNVKEIDVLLAGFKTKNRHFYTTTFEVTNEIHTFWQVKDGADIEALQKAMDENIPHTFIADGHHRCSTASLLHKRMKKQGKGKFYRKLLISFFPQSELEVHDYNRVVEGLNDWSQTQFMAKLSALFNIKPIQKGRKPKKKHEITMFFDNEWYVLTWREKLLKNHKEEDAILDTKLLDDLVMEKILGIEDVRTDTRIKYVEGPVGLEEVRQKTLKNENRIGFCLFPVRLEDLMQIAEKHEVMPPKSTWFEPRIKNGLIVLEMEPNKEG